MEGPNREDGISPSSLLALADDELDGRQVPVGEISSTTSTLAPLLPVSQSFPSSEPGRVVVHHLFVILWPAREE